LFNAAQESGYSYSVSPVDTEWAYGSIGDWQNLSYESWGRWSGGSPDIGRGAVVHLISDNVYLAVTFTQWTEDFGGGFCYERSTPAVIIPDTPVLLAPTNSTLTDTDSLDISWQSVTDVTGYLVNLAGNVVDVGSSIISNTGALATGTYTWTVAAYNDTVTSDYAAPWAFAVTGDPVTVTLTSPVTETVIPFGDIICGSVIFTETGTLPEMITVTYTYNYPSVDHNGLLGQYEITAEGGADYETAVTLCYEHTDFLVGGIDLAEEPNLHAYRFVQVGQPWQQYSEVDTVANTVTAHKVTEFGVFGLGIETNQPTRVSVRELRAGNTIDMRLVALALFAAGLVTLATRKRE
jgi:hypothetical protein